MYRTPRRTSYDERCAQPELASTPLLPDAAEFHSCAIYVMGAAPPWTVNTERQTQSLHFCVRSETPTEHRNSNPNTKGCVYLRAWSPTTFRRSHECYGNTLTISYVRNFRINESSSSSSQKKTTAHPAEAGYGSEREWSLGRDLSMSTRQLATPDPRGHLTMRG